MKDFPALPDIARAPAELLDGGHLWLLELVDGVGFRFRLDDAGRLRFGDETRVFREEDDVPMELRHAARHVRERFDRDALRTAVSDVAGVTFFGVATTHRTLAYDWERTPSFLGTDVWSADAGEFRPPDTAAQIFDRLGLRPVNAFEKERHTRDFSPSSYDVPGSAWYDGPAKGVVVRNKRDRGGRRAAITHPRFREKTEATPVGGDESEVVAELLPPERFDRIARELEARGWTVTADALYERALEAMYRENHDRLNHRESDADPAALRSAIAARVQAFVENESR